MTTREQDFLRYLVQRLRVDTNAVEEWLVDAADTEVEAALDEVQSEGIIPRLLAGAIEDRLKECIHQGIAKWVSTLTQ